MGVKSIARLNLVAGHLSPKTHLCFRPAYEQLCEKKISWDEYLYHGLFHYTQDFDSKVAGHAEDMHGYTLANMELKDIDPFGYVLWSGLVPATVGSVQDVAKLEAVFGAYKQGSVDDVTARLEVLPEYTAHAMRQLLALLALRDRKLVMLRLVMQESMLDPYGSYAFQDVANGVDKAQEPELFEIIQQSNWRKFNSWRAPGYRPPPKTVGAPDGAEYVFGPGGKIPIPW